MKFDHRMPGSREALRGLSFDGVAAVGDRPPAAALRRAHGELRFQIATTLETLQP